MYGSKMQNEEQRKLFADGCVPPPRNPLGTLWEAVLDAAVRVLTGGKCRVNRFPDGRLYGNVVKK